MIIRCINLKISACYRDLSDKRELDYFHDSNVTDESKIQEGLKYQPDRLTMTGEDTSNLLKDKLINWLREIKENTETRYMKAEKVIGPEGMEFGSREEMLESKEYKKWVEEKTREYTQDELEKIKRLNKKMFGDEESIGITTGMLENTGIFGFYNKLWIQLANRTLKSGPLTTYYEEAFHKGFDILTNTLAIEDGNFVRDENGRELTEQEVLLNEMRKKKGNEKKTNIELEEELADAFIEYAYSRSGITGRIKLIFDKVILRIKGILSNFNTAVNLANKLGITLKSNELKARQIFNDILTGEVKRIKNYELKIMNKRGAAGIRYMGAEKAGVPGKNPKIIKLAREYWIKYGVKSPFFRQWFGEAGLYNKSDIEIVKIYNIPDWKGSNKELHEKAFYYALKNDYFKTKFKNKDTGWDDIIVSKEGLDHDLSKTTNRDNFLIIPKLRELIDKAILVESNPDRKGNRNIIAFHRFYSVCNINGKNNLVKFTIRETTEGKRYYESALTEIKKSEFFTGPGSKRLLANPFSDQINIKDFVQLVKDNVNIASLTYSSHSCFQQARRVNQTHISI